MRLIHYLDNKENKCQIDESIDYWPLKLQHNSQSEL